jgi:acetyl-CoA carboxylase carboxyltransferase component
MKEDFKGGGEQATEKQKASCKLTASERIIALVDPNSFHEDDLFVKHAGVDFDTDKKYLPGNGIITGTGSPAGLSVFSHRILLLQVVPWDICMPKRSQRLRIMR